MAEAIAIPAAVVQFLDVGVCLSLKLGELISDLRDIPELLHRVKCDLDQQLAIAKHNKSSHAIFSTPSPTSAGVVVPMDQVIADYMDTMDRIVSIVQSVSGDKDSGTLRRGWNAVRAVHKQKEIMRLCDFLERKKSTIILWLGNANFKLSFESKEFLAEMQSDVRKTLEKTTNVEQSTSYTNSQLTRVPRLVRQADSTSSEIGQLVDNSSSNQHQVLESVERMSTDIRVVRETWEGFAPTFHQFQALVTGDPLLVPTTSQSAPTHTGKPRWDAPSTDLSRPMFTSSCTCKIANQTTQLEVLPFAHFRKVMRQNYYGGCPKSSTSDITLELLITVILPLWLLRYTINLSMVIRRSNSNGAWKISPIVLGASRVVDPVISPAFQAIRNAR